MGGFEFNLNPNDPNVAMLELAAKRLGPELCKQLVFVGGAIVGLLVTDPANSAIRPTEDVDTIVEIASLAGYHSVSKALRGQGFAEDLREGAPICRWHMAGLTLDVMPTDEAILGFSNKWYAHALESAQTVVLGSGATIRVVSAPVFIGTKLEAFAGRGAGDYLFSHDLGDIINVIDGRGNLIAECIASEMPLRKYLAVQFTELLGNASFRDSLPGHLPGDPVGQGRLPELRAKIRQIASIT